MYPHPDYEAIIGLEVHAQLLTESKLFCACSTAFGEAPNANVCPICLGHPGVLPVLNERAVEFALRMGLATHCRIAARSWFARKNYFYPDLPKGYQISQYETPLCSDGYVEIEWENGQRKRVGILRIHLEEDAGKSLHDQDPYHTLVDLNRCGVPLIEIVSAPDLRSPQEAVAYLVALRQLVRYLGICDGNMEEGSLRCDANVSVRRRGSERLGTKTEIKNMNSFRFVERALAYEIERQIGLLERGLPVVQQTLLWDPVRMETRPMRTKEQAHDYRYFPEPDLVPICVTEALLERVRQALPEMPEARRQRFIEQYGLPEYDARILTETRELADYYEAVVAHTQHYKAASNWVMTQVLRVLNERSISVRDFPVPPAHLAALIRLRDQDLISSSAAQRIFEVMCDDPRDPETLARELNLLQVSDDAAIEPLVEAVLAEHPAEVEAYLRGKVGLLGFFVGQVMRASQGKANPQRTRELVLQKLRLRAEANGANA
ncbi:MAG: Asp-tRNA(Asn)/Glu-tRNA(Gln) amidotransferase subunit GatB [Bacteroidetes bacterium]|nr:Asp-tRNA(Asn)/Glu-tRNA(Gln) amidotransferase subunit GatB [Rhodothermia bacterium]MCS7154202.1 Asp-tRNA(Asn)/Glu-tRNA(Gln) amidotransferase subunit GatB [Bacteroidota bacterium]MCX7906762.1 Asp-tRNA(Asn)/Glu-tRNA(Gln) amidotransferase subunit GatB [Bacteroidota bacterium]MDW8136958.1 Asp-tRNA(Asn)/Glu-tRNA(Gln) amidotransferase subunit GatB [Bacteroidota bacterium]MDW8285171.1 Asp-tRNA(Asn)/Glu-tRNA(Gln) amidotransferase subunit GatB [Bacteroidota bacterium]